MEDENINPWRDIWTRPRETMRALLKRDTSRIVVWLAIISGVVSSLNIVFSHWSPPREISKHYIVLTIAIIVGGILGVVMLYFMSWLLKLTGSWLGGKGSFNDVKSAVGWNNYPNIVGQIFSLIRLFILQNYWLQIILALISFALAIWSFIISLKLIGESHRFSAWKSLFAILIAIFLIFVVIMLVVLLIPLLKPLF